MFPSGSHLPRSPVRYIRVPSPTNGSATNRSAVNPGRFMYPRATPAPPMYNSPLTPTGTGSPCRSNMYIRAFEIGRPIGIEYDSVIGTDIVNVQQPTVVSVGPKRLISLTPGKRFCQTR